MRIISLVPSITELLFDLGLENEIVGITKYCIHPEEKVSNYTSIGGTKTIDIDKVKSLNPSLVIANKEENVESQIAKISLFCDVYVSEIYDIDSALDMILRIGELTRREKESVILTAKIRAKFIEKKEKKGSAIYLIWNAPMMTVGGDTFIHSMMKAAGYDNLFENEQRYPTLDEKKLIELEPNFLLLSTEPYAFKPHHVSYYQSLLPNTIVKIVDGEKYSWYGSRMLHFQM
jgi:ABC-type Fe3+-hydroxamate transport system substrate-binding protein